MNRRLRRRAAGFTLLEVMVALVIIGASLAAVFGSFYQSKRLAWRAEERLTATRLLHNLLQDRQLLLEAAAAGSVGGRLENARDWRYELTAEPLTVTGADGEELEARGMSRLTVCLSHERGGRERRFCLERWVRR